MVATALHIVVGWDGRVACRGLGSLPTMVWREVAPDSLWPMILTWETREGAQKFARMNGGTVTTWPEFSKRGIVTPVTAPV